MSKLDKKERELFLTSKGYSIDIPDNTDSRITLSWALFQQEEPDYEAILMVCDLDQDHESADTLNLLGIIYDAPKFRLYSAEKSHKLFLEAAERGSAAAAYNIGHRWLKGYNGPIDKNRALYWYSRAHEMGHGCAVTQILPLLFETQGNTPENIILSKKLLAEAIERGGAWALYQDAIMCLYDRNSEDYNLEKGLKALERLTSTDTCGKPKSFSAEILALRHYLGLGVTQNFHKAEHYLSLIPIEEQDPDVKHKIRNLSERILYITASHIASSEDKQATAELQRIYKDNDYQIKGEHTEALSNQLWAALELAKMESWPDRWQWYNLWEEVQLSLIGITQEDVEIATSDVGFFYNVIDQYKIPTLGAIEQPGNFLSPVNGLLNVTAILGNSNGEIIIKGDVANDGTSYISQEDIDVTKILAFRQKQGPVWLSLSLEPYDIKKKENLRWSFAKKVFDPLWIGHTNIGKTLYSADYYLGHWAWNSTLFNNAVEGILSEESNKIIKQFLNQIQVLGGRNDGLWSRVMLKPEMVSIDWKSTRQNEFEGTLNGIKMAIEGADTSVSTNGVEDRTLNLDDDRYSTGRVAGFLTYHYDTIAKLFPLYERAKQILALVYLMNGLREQGFKPNADEMKHIEDKYAHYQGLPKLQLKDLIVK